MSARHLLMAAGAVGVAALIGGIAGMGPADPLCERPADAWRPLTVNRAPDMEHLRDDVAKAREAAAAFADAVATRPLLSDSVDAQAGARTAPARARAWCEATLAVRIATDHQLPLDVVRAEFGPALAELPMPQLGATHADADRTIGSTSVSPVVSRPSR